MATRKLFVASLCRNGILGGWIRLDEDCAVYRTNKLTVDERIRNLRMAYADIDDIRTGRLLLMPTVTIGMRNGEAFRFIVFARNRFLTRMQEMRTREQPSD